MKLTCCNVQAIGGESGQLTCHAPVTSRSVELDFLVGTENPIRLLYRGAGWGPRQQTTRSQTERTGFVGFSRFFGVMVRNWGRFYLWQDRGLDYRWTGGAGPRCQLPPLRWWLAQPVAYLKLWRESRRSSGRTGFNSCDFIMLRLILLEKYANS